MNLSVFPNVFNREFCCIKISVSFFSVKIMFYVFNLCGFFMLLLNYVNLFNSRLSFSAGCNSAPIVFYFVVLKFFCYTLVHSLFNILREMFSTSRGYFHSSLILIKVFLDSSKVIRNERSRYQKSKSERG